MKSKTKKIGTYLIFRRDEVILLVVLLQEDDDVREDDHDDLKSPSSTLLQRPDPFEHEAPRGRQDVRLLKLPPVVHDRRFWVDPMVDFQQTLFPLLFRHLGINVT